MRRLNSCPRLQINGNIGEFDMSNVINKTDKLILTQEDLNKLGIWKEYDLLRAQLYKADQRKDCIIVQGAAFVVNGKAFLMAGVGGIDFLDSLAQLDEVDGIIGNNNTIFVSKNFDHVYSAHNTQELVKCYELEGAPSHIKIKFLEDAPMAPLIFILRSFKSHDEYETTREKVGNVLFEAANTFMGPPARYAGSLKSRLRGKFLSTSRVMHCARRPTIEKKEALFDSKDKVSEAINNFKGHVALVYTLWSQVMCDAVGMTKTRELSKTYNPTDPITPHLLKIAKDFL